jgi:hypothetical protein
VHYSESINFKDFFSDSKRDLQVNQSYVSQRIMNWIEQGQNATAPPGASNSNITSNASTSVTQLGSLKTSALKCIRCLIHLLIENNLYFKCGRVLLIMVETKVDVSWLPNGKQGVIQQLRGQEEGGSYHCAL